MRMIAIIIMRIMFIFVMLVMMMTGMVSDTEGRDGDGDDWGVEVIR